MKAQTSFCLTAATLLSACLVSAAPTPPPTAFVVPPPSEILQRLRPEHPRLLASQEELNQLKSRVTSTPQLTNWFAQLQRRGERIVIEPPARYEIPDGLRLLSTSRRVLDRVYTLAMLYQLQGNRQHLDRAWRELETAAAFPDWNPRHFLDTAEMTHAFAIGYDWLYRSWTPEQRALLRESIVKKGLAVAWDGYRGANRYGWWAKSQHNWNQVCNGGIGLGALAIGDEVPELAGNCLQQALQSLPLAMAEFDPDGAWSEGPGYWNYATSYNVVFLAALQSALGTDFGLAQKPGFADTGLFPIYLTGPLNRTFNYADGGEGVIRAPQMFWLSRQFNRPEYAWYERQVASPSALDLLWHDTRGDGPTRGGFKLDKYFRGAEIATFRSGWEDQQALFVGFKAGDNKANHSNLDLGTFVLDALGYRWAVDLGADDYNLPGYFGNQRWTYYRMRAEGHNTLVINPTEAPDQDPKAAAQIVRFDSQPARAFAIADLSAAYGRGVGEVRRGVALLNRNQVLVQDEIRGDAPADLWWFLHTPAQIELRADTSTAVLRQGAARLLAQIVSPDGARFEVKAALPLPSSPHPVKQAQNQTLRKLAVHAPGTKPFRLSIVLAPFREGEAVPVAPPTVTSLDEW